MAKNMTPDQIKANLKDRGFSQSGLARDMGCSPQHVFRVIKEPTYSFPVASHIAKALGKTLPDIWPETYPADPEPPKVGRPLTRGLYNPRAA